jgi:hypothetical protein
MSTLKAPRPDFLRNRLRLNRIDATIAVCLFAIGRVQKHSSDTPLALKVRRFLGSVPSYAGIG